MHNDGSSIITYLTYIWMNDINTAYSIINISNIYKSLLICIYIYENPNSHYININPCAHTFKSNSDKLNEWPIIIKGWIKYLIWVIISHFIWFFTANGSL